MFQIVHSALVCEKSTLQIVLIMALVCDFSTIQIVLMALIFCTQSPAYYKEFCQHMAQIKLNTIQTVHTHHYEKLLIQIVKMAHICENDMIQIKYLFQLVAMWLQFSTEE